MNTVTHNNKQYTVTKLANGHSYRLTSVTKPRESLTLNRWQMHIAGLLEQVEVKA